MFKIVGMTVVGLNSGLIGFVEPFPYFARARGTTFRVRLLKFCPFHPYVMLQISKVLQGLLDYSKSRTVA